MSEPSYLPTYSKPGPNVIQIDNNTEGLTMALEQIGLVRAPFPPSIRTTGGDIATSRLLDTWVHLILTLQVRPLSQKCTTRPLHRPWQRSLLHCEMEPSAWPGLATPLRGKRLRQAHGGLLLSLHQIPVNGAIQASLTRTNDIPETVKKREL